MQADISWRELGIEREGERNSGQSIERKELGKDAIL